MSLSLHLAKHLREAYHGGNWTAINLRGLVAGLEWQQVTTQVHGFHSIATIVYHMTHDVQKIAKVLEGGPLEGMDAPIFTHPPISSQEDWDKILEQVWQDVEYFAGLIEQFPEERLWEEFIDPIYGNYYRNLQGITEHVHYHLGQIVLIKRIILASSIA